MKSFGQTLKEARELVPFTLRQVEEATGVSNGYLSQLENDKIKYPSANVLYKLANIYNVDLEVFLRAAGIIIDKKDSPNKMLQSGKLPSYKLSSDEEEELLKYLRFLRFNKK
jgi:transcriptional regulator with XRE-family HTH domain